MNGHGLPPRIAIASRNPHKIAEVRRICATWPVEWLTDGDAWPDVDETGDTFLDNALLKATAIAAEVGIPALADDSGIEVDALGGAPGVRSARYAGERPSDADNRAALLRALAGVPRMGRTARFHCVVVLAFPDGATVHADGSCEGTVLTAERGEGGFGYDPLFVPAGWDRTMAELPPEEKDRIGHRGRALRALRAALDATR